MENEIEEKDGFYSDEYEDEDLDAIMDEPLAEDLNLIDEDEDIEMSEEDELELRRLQAKAQKQDMILRIFTSLQEKPSQEEIEGFKHQYGECYLVSFSEQENFLFRPLKRQEWRTMMTQTAKLDEFKKSEAIVIKGIVWPALNNINIGGLTAGTVETLRDLILEASNFMTPDRAVQLVRKL